MIDVKEKVREIKKSSKAYQNHLKFESIDNPTDDNIPIISDDELTELFEECARGLGFKYKIKS